MGACNHAETPAGRGRHRHAPRWIARAAAALALLTLLPWWPGCATPGPVAPPPADGAGRVWPAPPEPARIAYVRAVNQPADLGIRPARLTRLVNWLTGAARGREPLLKPFGVTMDEDDNLCLTDTGARVVIHVDRTNGVWRRWERAGDVRFVAPVAVARRAGTFYVADSALGCVLAFRAEGPLLLRITNGLERPTAVVLSGDRLLVADAARHCVVAFDLAGNPGFEFGRRGTEPGEFNYPTHLAVDGQQRIYVTDSMNHRVQVFDPTGKPLRQFGRVGDAPGCFSRPKGLATDSQGHVYVVDAGFDNFQIFDPQGRILLGVGQAGSGPGQFWLPNGMAISRRDEIFVADAYNRRIQVFEYIKQAQP